MLSIALSFFAPLLYFLLSTITLIFSTKKSFGRCLPLALVTPAFLLFLSQLLFGSFTPGFILALIFALAAVPLLFVKRNDLASFKKLIFTPGLIAFCVVYLVIFIFDFSRHFAIWDELTHWGMMVKEMARLDKFYYVAESNLMVHKDYPPAMQLLELFWTKLCGGFSEPYVERALHTFELSLIVPFVSERIFLRFAASKKYLKTIACSLALTFVVVLVLLLFDGHGVFHTIYTDYALALVVVYLLLTIYLAPKITSFEIITISIMGAFLLLMKQIGLPLYCLALAFLSLRILLDKPKRISLLSFIRSHGMKRLVLVSILLTVPFALLVIWNSLVAGVDAQFAVSDLSPLNLLAVIRGGGESWQRLAFQNFLLAIAEKPISVSFVPISFLQCFVWLAGLVWLCGKKQREENHHAKTIALIVTMTVGGLGYALVMLILYITSFGADEGPALASFDRYMGTFAIIMILVPLFLLIANISDSKNLRPIYLLAGLLFITVSPGALSRLYPAILPRETIYSKYQTAAESIISQLPQSSANILVLSEEKANTEGAHFFLQYYLTPHKVTLVNTLDGVDPSSYDYFYINDASEAMLKTLSP